MDGQERLPLDLLVAIPAVLATAEEGSATQAAARLGTTPATVLRRIGAAESVLGVKLFDRLPTGLVGTAALTAVLPWAQRFATSIDGMQRDVAGLDVRPDGIVRVAVPPTAASHILIPELHRLHERAPGVVVEFDSAVRVLDLGQREADIAVRGRKPTDGDLVLRRLADYDLVPVCAPSLAERYRHSPSTLPWVSWERSMSAIHEARWLADAVPDARVVLRASDLVTLLHAARAGVGVVLAPSQIAALEGGLVQVPLPGVQLPSGASWLVTHRALRRVDRVAVVWDWIAETFEALAARTSLALPMAWVDPTP